MAQNPLSSRTPIRNFRSDLSIVCDVADGILALAAALKGRVARDPSVVSARLRDHTARNSEARRAVLRRAEGARDGACSKEWVSLCLSRAIDGSDAVVLSELGCPMAPMTLRHHDSWYQEPHAGGLGWSFPASLGMQLARPDRLVVATMGDGSYMFSNPVACHQIAEALDLPVLLIILNNSEWFAVRQSVLGMYPEGHASRANKMPLTGLGPSPDYCRVAEASRA